MESDIRWGHKDQESAQGAQTLARPARAPGLPLPKTCEDRVVERNSRGSHCFFLKRRQVLTDLPHVAARQACGRDGCAEREANDRASAAGTGAARTCNVHAATEQPDDK